MRLTEAQSRALLAKHGVYVTEVCDRCGKILGHVRFTLKDQPGEWCSRQCRDGARLVSNETATHKGGRPQKYRDERQRRQANVQYQREFRQRQQEESSHASQSKKNPLVTDSFHVSTEADFWPLAIPIAGERV
jgi:hypothetical protein